MVITLKNARRICNTLIDNQYPGYVLLLDKMGPQAYLSLWGKGAERVEIAFPRVASEPNVKANIARYKIF